MTAATSKPDVSRLTRAVERPGTDIIDEALLGRVRLCIIGSDHDPADRRFAPIFPEDKGAQGRADFDRAVVEAMRDGLTLSTRRGAVIEFRGAPPRYQKPLDFDPGFSSNSLSLMDLAGTAHAHKVYHHLAPASREPSLLRAMAGSGLTQHFVGEYVYQAVGGGRIPLGLIYQYAEGDGLDVPLRASLHSLWEALVAGMPVDLAVSSAVNGLEHPLTRAGRFLLDFHKELDARIGVDALFPFEAFTAATGERIGEVAAMVKADGLRPAVAGESVVDALWAEWSLAAKVPRADWRAGACHGDLHLSHFLRAEQSRGVWRMRLIDLSTPPLEVDGVGFIAQSPWQDVVALLRGLDCFASDELAHRVGLDLCVPKSEVGEAAYLRAAGLQPYAPGWTADRLAHLEHLRRAAAAWQGRISGFLVRGYAPLAGGALHPAWRMLRLHRLLHELVYAYENGRPYFAAINLRHALEGATGAGRST